MPNHVTSVTLTTETSDRGLPLWRLSWTESSNTQTWTKTHDTEQAARQHATGLVAKRPPGAEVADVFTDARASADSDRERPQ